MEANMEKNVINILNTVVKVITNPVGFFRSMPKEGGFQDPLIFAVALGVVAGVLRAFLAIVHLGYHLPFLMAIFSIIMVPFLVAIFGFVGAAIMFVIWKILGSGESFETAYRCGAYAGGIVPITTLLSIIPYLGSIIGIVWLLYLMVVASSEVHKIEQKRAVMVFGIICALLVIRNTCSQFTARKMQKEMDTWSTKMKDMTPEEAGKSLGEFMKGVEKGSGTRE
jgi:hypothetical protein